MRQHEINNQENAWLGLKNRPAFVAIDEPAVVVWPALAFQPSSSGGHGTVTITGSRFDLLDRSAPAWQEAVMTSASAAGMPLLARKIGRAHKHAFWRIDAASPSDAQASSVRIKAEKDAAQAAWEEESLRSSRMSDLRKFGRKLSEDEAIVLENGDLVFADMVIERPIRDMWGSVPALALVDGEPVPFPAGASVEKI
ncbi:hypothetical protein [Accumulibacter sp.]|uniref:hypothetical protein n=1 Tax=Accumulibacter sp. TaxID=2053492 RepID=UPI002D12930B|nr:hypothetical protein [Accumulibacter sp.]HRF06330.1 hypothetical protein [Accumulibacter sp.]